MHFAPQPSFKPTDESEKVNIGKAAIIWLMGSLSTWMGVYLLFRRVVGGE